MAFQDYSLIQAPMAGGLSTADVVAGASLGRGRPQG